VKTPFSGTYKTILLKKLSFFKIVLILFMVLFIECAYLNTFYNAKIAFNRAFKAHKKLMQDNADTTEQLPPEISEGYKRTIAKATKVIKVYPKRKRWHDDALFLKGKATFYNKEMRLAIQRFRQFLKEFPKSPFIPEAYLFLGKAYLGNDNLQKAEETFLLILEKYPELNKNEDITLLLAEVAIQREGKSQAIMILKESLASVKSDEKKMDIVIKLCGLYIELKLYDDAIKTLADAPRNKDYPHFLFHMDYYLIICYKNLNKHNDALVLIDQMLKNKQYITYKPKIMLEKGIVLKLMGKFKEAVEILLVITKMTAPPDILGKAWLELAYIHQYEYGDFEKAKEYYEKALSESTDEKIREIASEKISGIDLMNEYKELLKNKGTAKDSSDTSETIYSIHYKLGEVYWLNLSETDSALNHFTLISTDTLADSVLIMKSFYARAWILRFIKEDTTTADSLYKMIIKRYPATVTAKKSQQDLGIPVTIRTHKDSAQIAFIAAERLYHDDNNIISAINAYYKVAKKFMDVEDIALKSLYSAAWICDNKYALRLFS
jgi:TolA-binding protein